MKPFLSRIILLYLFAAQFLSVARSQSIYSFKNAVLVSGTALQDGAKYRFTNVKSGVDALITVKSQTGGIILTDIDNNSTGFDEAFQPFINVATNSSGYVEFQVDFVNTGTSTPNVQATVPITCIDVDGVTYGDGVLYEQDQVQYFPGYYDFTMTGTNLQVTNPGSWVVIKNTSGFSYPGIDTSAKDVMATVVNKGISTMLLRIGAINTSPTESETRYRSVYFKTFDYGHPAPLPNRTMLSLSGSKKQNGVELKGMLSSNHSYTRMIIQRATTASEFSYIGEMDISGTNTAIYPFTYFDDEAENGVNYYRIRLVSSHSNIEEISNTLMVKMNNGQGGPQIINTLLQTSNPVLTIKSPEDADADLQAIDMSGRTMNTMKIKIYNGTTNINLPEFKGKGFFVIVIRTKKEIISQRMLVQ